MILKGENKKRSLPGGEAGFTLVEVIVVVIIIGVLVTVATIGVNRAIAHWNLVTAARTLVSDIRETRDNALTLGTGAQVRFYQDWGYYERRIGEEVYEAVYLPVRVRFVKLTFDEDEVHAGVYKLHFAPSGNPAQAGSAYLKNSVGEYRAVKVLVGTGRVRITEEAPP